MELAHDQHGHMDDGHAVLHHHGPRTLPASLAAPAEVLLGWRRKAVIVALVATIVSLLFIFLPGGRGHILRGYLLGYTFVFGLAGGGLALLMLQYVSGGKWGLLLRRPLEAMARTLPLIVLFLVPLGIPAIGKKLWLWARFRNPEEVANGVKQYMISESQGHSLNAKHAMLSVPSFWVEAVLIFAVMGLLVFLLSKWSLDRDADPAAGTQRSYDAWRVRFENVSGPGILAYVIMMSIGVIVWVMSLDITWYSSVWGLQFLVGQGFAVLALSILSVILLSRFEPMRTLLRTTEQHDLGKFLFAFVMLNIYLSFAAFLIIWSGNLPEEVPWYLNRTRGGWWVICMLDFIFHWVIPFTLLLSRDLKRSKSKMIWLTCWMLFARAFDLFWLIEPNFGDASRNLHLAGNWGILAYIPVTVGMVAIWAVYYITNLMSRPLVNTNDPHLAEMLEPEHAH